jgi:hypothetical protein
MATLDPVRGDWFSSYIWLCSANRRDGVSLDDG